MLGPLIPRRMQRAALLNVKVVKNERNWYLRYRDVANLPLDDRLHPSKPSNGELFNKLLQLEVVAIGSPVRPGNEDSSKCKIAHSRYRAQPEKATNSRFRKRDAGSRLAKVGGARREGDAGNRDCRWCSKRAKGWKSRLESVKDFPALRTT